MRWNAVALTVALAAAAGASAKPASRPRVDYGAIAAMLRDNADVLIPIDFSEVSTASLSPSSQTSSIAIALQEWKQRAEPSSTVSTASLRSESVAEVVENMGYYQSGSTPTEESASVPVVEALVSFPYGMTPLDGMPASEGYTDGNFWEGTSYASIMGGCEERWHVTRVDHFSRQTDDTFAERWYYCPQHYRKGGPVLAVLGCEDTIESIMQTLSFVWEVAPLLGAATVWLEHRYYGESLPYDEDYFENLAYLSQAQALADYAEVLFQVRRELGDRRAPTYGFGASYCGELVVKMRMKYPHLLTGGIASAAPMASYYNMDPPYDQYGFARVVTECSSLFGLANPGCEPSFRAAFAAITELAETAEGLDEINSALNVCEGSEITSEDDVPFLLGAISEMWQSDGTSSGPSGFYPYVTACGLLTGTKRVEPAMDTANSTALLQRLSDALNFIAGSDDCLDLSDYVNEQGMTLVGPEETPPFGGLSNDTSVEDGSSSTTLVYNFQTCTEMFAPQSCNNVTDMFYPNEWNVSFQSQVCLDTYDRGPLFEVQAVQYGGRNLDDLTNLLYVNGRLDAWYPGCITESKANPVINIPLSGHGNDLMPATVYDPPALRAARITMYNTLKGWIDGANARRSR